MSKIIVLDLESTCWPDAPPEGEVSDIIEIGLCALDLRSLEVFRPQSIVVRPTRSKVSEFSSKLNGWTQAQVDRGASLEQAFGQLRREYDSKYTPWASWGAYDRKMISSSAADFHLVDPMSRKHLNVKTLFSTLYDCEKDLAMNTAFELVAQHRSMKFIEPHHSGVADAQNIAQILAAIIEQFRAGA